MSCHLFSNYCCIAIYQTQYFQAERWRKKLREGDHVIIKGIHFVVANKSFIAMDDKSSTLNASKLSSLPTKSERKSNAAMSVMSDDTNEGTESYAPSKQTGSVKSGDEDDKEDDNLDDLDEDDEEIETGSRDEEMGVVEVVDTPEHIRMNRCWILDSEEGVEIYKMVPKAFFERQIFKVSV